MIAAFIRTSDQVTLVGGAPVDKAIFDESSDLAPVIVAADGGAHVALGAGRMPDAVIGDLDSLGESNIPTERIHQVIDQDRTDFEKALVRIDAPLVLAVGFVGGRLDHELAVYSALVQVAHPPAIVIGPEDICFHASADVCLDLPLGTRVSLFPLRAMQCDSTGLLWATKDLTLSPMGRVGTSNEAVGPVWLRPDGPGMLVILPRAVLSQVIAALHPDSAAVRAK